MSVTGEKDDLPGGGPQKVGVAFADLTTGLYATIAIQAALLNRTMTGLGQYIDMALLDVQVATLANQGMNYLSSGKVPGRYGNAHANIVPYQVFKAADKTDYPREVCEHVLAHKLPDEVEAAYLRGAYLEKRKNLMADWASYATYIEA